jgi:hypothetical protein
MIYSSNGMDLVRTINLEIILYKMLRKRITIKYYDNMNHVVTSSCAGKMNLAESTF